MYPPCKLAAAACLTLLLLAGHASAQWHVIESNFEDWLCLGLGTADISSSRDLGIEGDLSFLISLNVQNTPHLIAVRYLHHGSVLNRGLGEVGVLYERVLSRGAFYLAGGAGLSYVFRARKGLIPEGSFGQFGLPLEVQLYFRRIQHIGLGMTCFADLNSQRSFYGAVLGIQIGNF